MEIVSIALALLFGALAIFLLHLLGIKKHRLFLLDPFPWLLEEVHLGRIVGEQQRIEQLMSYLKGSLLGSNTQVEQLLGLMKDSAGEPASIVSVNKLSLWGEQRIIEVGQKRVSVLLGDLNEVIEKCSSSWLGELTEREVLKLRSAVSKAEKNGFIVLAVASCYLHGDKTERDHHLLGYLLIEPSLSQKKLQRYTSLAARDRRVLISALSRESLESLFYKISPAEKLEHSISAQALFALSPEREESFLDRAQLVAQASFKDRYKIIRYYERRYDCSMLSSQSDDAKLPVRLLR